MLNHEGKKIGIFFGKIKDSMGKTNFFFGALPFTLWVVLAMWLHIGAPKKIQEKRIYNHFECNILGVSVKLVKYIVHLFKRKN
jgi:hypothetical protein